jgi:hypothetical protein
MLTNSATHIVVVDPEMQHPIGILSTLDIAGVLAWGRGLNPHQRPSPEHADSSGGQGWRVATDASRRQEPVRVLQASSVVRGRGFGDETGCARGLDEQRYLQAARRR